MPPRHPRAASEAASVVRPGTLTSSDQSGSLQTVQRNSSTTSFVAYHERTRPLPTDDMPPARKWVPVLKALAPVADPVWELNPHILTMRISQCPVWVESPLDTRPLLPCQLPKLLLSLVLDREAPSPTTLQEPIVVRDTVYSYFSWTTPDPQKVSWRATDQLPHLPPLLAGNDHLPVPNSCHDLPPPGTTPQPIHVTSPAESVHSPIQCQEPQGGQGPISCEESRTPQQASSMMSKFRLSKVPDSPTDPPQQQTDLMSRYQLPALSTKIPDLSFHHYGLDFTHEEVLIIYILIHYDRNDPRGLKCCVPPDHRKIHDVIKGWRGWRMVPGISEIINILKDPKSPKHKEVSPYVDKFKHSWISRAYDVLDGHYNESPSSYGYH